MEVGAVEAKFVMSNSKITTCQVLIGFPVFFMSVVPCLSVVLVGNGCCTYLIITNEENFKHSSQIIR